MIELELIVSTAVDFEYLFHHPYWPLHGFFLDMQCFIQKLDIPIPKKQSALQNLFGSYTSATLLVPKAISTDLLFLYSPSQIALACLWASDTPHLLEYIEWKFSLPGKYYTVLISC